MQMQEVSSSQIAAIGYDNNLRQMAVKFKGSKNKPGSVYLYEGPDVTLELFQHFLAAPSKGKFLATNIKPLKRIVTRKVGT